LPDDLIIAATFRVGLALVKPNLLERANAVHPQLVGIGARRLRRFTVAPSTALAEFQPRRPIPAEGRAPTDRQLRDAPWERGSTRPTLRWQIVRTRFVSLVFRW